jgi:hypothetical protein
MTLREQMVLLARSFPTLQECPSLEDGKGDRALAPGIYPEGLDKWACGPAPGHGARCAAQFILAVFNTSRKWKCGRFDLMEAMGCWDAEHRAAFVAWAKEPWWP